MSELRSICYPKNVHAMSLSYLKEATMVTNTTVPSVRLALNHFDVPASNKFQYLRKASSIRKNVHVPAASVDAVFSKTRARFRNYVGTWWRSVSVIRIYRG